VIPVGAFGAVGRALWNERSAQIAVTHPMLSHDFRALAGPELSDADIVGAIGRLLDALSSAVAPDTVERFPPL
jgi:hypothetical protein